LVSRSCLPPLVKKAYFGGFHQGFLGVKGPPGIGPKLKRGLLLETLAFPGGSSPNFLKGLFGGISNRISWGQGLPEWLNSTLFSFLETWISKKGLLHFKSY